MKTWTVLYWWKGAICAGASHGNAGWIFPSHSVPIPGPGVVRKSARWLLDPESPLYIRPRASLSLARWLLRFARSSSEKAMRRTTALRRELSTLSLARFEKLAALPGLDCGFRRLGLLIVCAAIPGWSGCNRYENRATAGHAIGRSPSAE